MKESFLAAGCKKTFLRSEDCFKANLQDQGLAPVSQAIRALPNLPSSSLHSCGLVVSHLSFKILSQPGCPTSAFDHHSMLPIQQPAFGHYLQPQSYGRMPAKKIYGHSNLRTSCEVTQRTRTFAGLPGTSRNWL